MLPYVLFHFYRNKWNKILLFFRAFWSKTLFKKSMEANMEAFLNCFHTIYFYKYIPNYQRSSEL